MSATVPSIRLYLELSFEGWIFPFRSTLACVLDKHYFKIGLLS